MSQTPAVLDEPGAPPAGSMPLHLRLRASLALRASMAVVLAHAVLLPLSYRGIIGAYGFGLTALALSGFGVFFLVQHSSRGGMAPYAGSGGDEPHPAKHRSGDSLNRNLQRLRRSMREREPRLKSAPEAARPKTTASRIVTERLTRAQNIAHLGSWEWG